VRERRVLELTDEALCCCLGGERFLAVGLLDNTARVFFADTFKFFLTLYGHSLPVTCIDISDVIARVPPLYCCDRACCRTTNSS
jgi:U3 small nucleolar RNA-associated protein 12